MFTYLLSPRRLVPYFGCSMGCKLLSRLEAEMLGFSVHTAWYLYVGRCLKTLNPGTRQLLGCINQYALFSIASGLGVLKIIPSLICYRRRATMLRNEAVRFLQHDSFPSSSRATVSSIVNLTDFGAIEANYGICGLGIIQLAQNTHRNRFKRGYARTGWRRKAALQSVR